MVETVSIVLLNKEPIEMGDNKGEKIWNFFEQGCIWRVFQPAVNIPLLAKIEHC